ncbi:MAG: Zn-dependent alcohol dehydrogenase [Gordonia sp. (in: high G+C Gram-positive bacteria)]|uniref:zinc-binding dehydrogenase n=1 Tax=Gordonia sp. (in: high G+C Gram-positive bacteria) TaxID=84139 RepID=UPI0039E49573
MKTNAMVLLEIGKPLELREIELDAPRSREVVIDVKASGLCHSDLHFMQNDFGVPLPAVLGHEVAGVVSQVGSEVTRLKVGDHVVTNLISACGQCVRCQQGDQVRCLDPDAVRRRPDEKARYTLDGRNVPQLGDIGGFAEKILVHERNATVVDETIPFSRAALLGCAVVTGVGAAKNGAPVRFGDSVAVIGCGGVGLNVVQGAALAGAREVIAIDLHPEKRELAKRFGATDTIDPTAEDVLARVREITPFGGVDIAFEVVGLEETAQQALAITNVGGRAYVLGVMKPGTEVVVPGPALLAPQKHLAGNYMGSTVADEDIPLYAEMYNQGRLNLDDLVADEIRLEDVNEAYRRLEEGATARSVIVFD